MQKYLTLITVVCLVVATYCLPKRDMKNGAFVERSQAESVLKRVKKSMYHEECVEETCDSEEIREMQNSYRSECLEEGCFDEEINENGLPSHLIPNGKRKYPSCGMFCIFFKQIVGQ